MTCKYCQKEIRDGLETCPECGRKQNEPEKPAKVAPRFTAAAVIIGAITVLICVAAVIIVSIQLPQPKPADLFGDYDIAFTGYELVQIPEEQYKSYSYDYDADIYNRQNMVNVYFTLTNLADHEIMLDKIDANDMSFTLWAQDEIKDREKLTEAELLEKLDETPYTAYGLHGNFYDANNQIIRFYFNQKSLLPGESCNAVVTMRDDINGGLNFYSSYVEVNYKDAAYFWDLKDNFTTRVELTDPNYPDAKKLSKEEYEKKMEEYRKAQFEFEKSEAQMF